MPEAAKKVICAREFVLSLSLSLSLFLLLSFVLPLALSISFCCSPFVPRSLPFLSHSVFISLSLSACVSLSLSRSLTLLLCEGAGAQSDTVLRCVKTWPKCFEAQSEHVLGTYLSLCFLSSNSCFLIQVWWLKKLEYA